MSTTKEEIVQQYIAANPGKGQYVIARLIMTDHPELFNLIDTAAKYVVRARGRTGAGSMASFTLSREDITPTPTPGRLSEDDLRRKYDTVFILRQKAAELEVGSFYTESDFIRQSGIRVGPGYRQALDHPDFAKYKGRGGNTTYWGHPESIAKMKHEMILS